MKFTVNVMQTVEIELDEPKFDETFMAEFREGFHNIQDIAGHAQHLAWLHATGRVDLEYISADVPFIEGYGPADTMGIKVRVIDSDTEISE